MNESIRYALADALGIDPDSHMSTFIEGVCTPRAASAAGLAAGQKAEELRARRKTVEGHHHDFTESYVCARCAAWRAERGCIYKTLEGMDAAAVDSPNYRGELVARLQVLRSALKQAGTS